MREYLSRLIGWSDTEAIDLAYRSVRICTLKLGPLVLAGRDNLPAIAASIHRRTLGPGRPFVVCDPRRGHAECSVRSALNYSTATEALEHAVGGTVLVHSRRLPKDFEAARAGFRNVRRVICRTSMNIRRKPYELHIIYIPDVRTRSDIDRVVYEYGAEAGVAEPADLEWVRLHSCDSHDEIEKGCRRIAALRSADTIGGAAAALGMARVSLERWWRRHEGYVRP